MKRRVDADGVVRIDSPAPARRWGRAALGGAVAAALVTGAFLLFRAPDSGPGSTAPAGSSAPAKGRPAPGGPGRTGEVAPGKKRASQAVSEPGARAPNAGDPGAGQAPSQDDDAQDDDAVGAAAPGQEGAPTEAAGAARGPLGMPAHGSKKIKVGLVVPEDFQLPEGYVRHYQTTDKGQMLPAILMFHPDHPPVDAQGRPVAVPADGVVPPDLAPPGLPHTWLDVPDDAYSNPDDPTPPTDEEKAAAEAAADGEGEGTSD